MSKQPSNEDLRNGQGRGSEEVPTRRRYSPPRILSREALEAVAGPCGKADPTDRTCVEQGSPSS